MRTPTTVVMYGAQDLATSAVGGLARASTAAAGALAGGALGAGLGALRGASGGALRGLARGANAGRRSTPATAVTVIAVGATGLLDWPVVLTIGGVAVLLDKTVNRQPRLSALPATTAGLADEDLDDAEFAEEHPPSLRAPERVR